MPNFCTRCGRPLSDGEVCSCFQPAPVTTPDEPETYFCTRCGKPLQPGEVCSCQTPPAMEFCTRCGKPLQPGEVCSCTANDNGFQFDQFKNQVQSTIGQRRSYNEAVYEKGCRIVPDNICADEGEEPIRQYEVAVLRTRSKFMQAVCRMQVTNKRLLCRATGRSLRGKTVLQHEFAIDEIAGLEINKSYRFSFIDLLVMLFPVALTQFVTFWVTMALYRATWVLSLLFVLALLGITGFLAITRWKKHFVNTILFNGALTAAVSYANIISLYSNGGLKFFGGFLYFVGFLCLVGALISYYLFCYKENLCIDVKTKGGMAPISIRRTKRSFFSVSMFGQGCGFSEVLPYTDTDVAIQELGALITDIQKLGDFGIKKWKKE